MSDEGSVQEPLTEDEVAELLAPHKKGDRPYCLNQGRWSKALIVRVDESVYRGMKVPSYYVTYPGYGQRFDEYVMGDALKAVTPENTAWTKAENDAFDMSRKRETPAKRKRSQKKKKQTKKRKTAKKQPRIASCDPEEGSESDSTEPSYDMPTKRFQFRKSRIRVAENIAVAPGSIANASSNPSDVSLNLPKQLGNPVTTSGFSQECQQIATSGAYKPIISDSPGVEDYQILFEGHASIVKALNDGEGTPGIQLGSSDLTSSIMEIEAVEQDQPSEGSRGTKWISSSSMEAAVPVPDIEPEVQLIAVLRSTRTTTLSSDPSSQKSSAKFQPRTPSFPVVHPQSTPVLTPVASVVPVMAEIGSQTEELPAPPPGAETKLYNRLLCKLMQSYIGKSVSGLDCHRFKFKAGESGRLVSFAAVEEGNDFLVTFSIVSECGKEVSKFDLQRSKEPEIFEKLKFDGYSLTEIVSRHIESISVEMPTFIAFANQPPDFFFISDEEKKYPAHYLVMSDISPFLADQLKDQPSEIKLEGCQDEVVEAFLELIYGKPCRSLKENYAALKIIFDELQIIGGLETFAGRIVSKEVAGEGERADRRKKNDKAKGAVSSSGTLKLIN